MTIGSWSIFKYPKLLLSTLAIGFFGSAINGYTNILNAPQDRVQDFANQSFYHHYRVVLGKRGVEFLWSAIQASLDLGALIGCFTVSYLMERYGRRNTCLLVTQLITLVSGIMQILARPLDSFELLLLGRFVSGSAASIATGALPLYLAEASPDLTRGLVGSLTSFLSYSWVPIGIALGMWQTFVNWELWPYLLGFAIVPAILSIILRFFVPESPKHLYIKEKSKKKAIEALLFFHGRFADVEGSLKEFEAEERLAHDQIDLSIGEILAQPMLRRSFFVGVMGLVSLDVLGPDAIGQYSTSLFESMGMSTRDSASASVYVRIPEMLIALCAVPFFDQWGRRPMMLGGLGFGLVGDVLVMVGGLTATPMCSILGMAIIYVAQRTAISPLGHFLVAEVCPQASRSKTAGYGLFFNWFGSFLIILIYPTMQSLIGWWAFGAFCVLTVIWFLWFARYLPETKMRPVDEIVAHIGDTNHDPPLSNYNSADYGAAR